MENLWSRFRKATTVMIVFKIIAVVSSIFNLWSSNQEETIKTLQEIDPELFAAPTMFDNIQAGIVILVFALIVILAIRARKDIVEEKMPSLLAYYLSFIFAIYRIISGLVQATLPKEGMLFVVITVIIGNILVALPELIAYFTARKLDKELAIEGQEKREI